MKKTFEQIKEELGEDYDEEKDEYEIILRRREYDAECEKMLRIIGERENVAAHLKIAAPAKISELRQLIQEYDELIELAEDYAALCYAVYEKAIECWKADLKLVRLVEAIEPEFLKYVAEHQPERLEEMQVLLADDGTNKSH